MRDVLNAGVQEDVSFLFEDHKIDVVWNELLLAYDANIYRQQINSNGEPYWVHINSVGGKSQKACALRARQIVLGRD